MRTNTYFTVSVKRFFALIFLLSPIIGYTQPGKDGALTVTAANTVVNCYTAVTANVASGSSTVTLQNASCNLQCGDLVMIYQAQGASINTTNTDQYGAITAYNSSGLYEFNYVVSVTGNVVTVQTAWANNYSAAGKTQLVKVPQYTTLTVNAAGSIVPLPWQDSGTFRRGGLVVIHATGTVTVNGSISASGMSFRPGVVEQNTTGAGGAAVLDFVTTSSTQSAEKGESIVGFGVEYDALGGRYGRGAPANAGGGGNGHNAGGGGGANANNGLAWNGQGVMCTACAGSAAWTLDPFVIANGGTLTNSSGGGRGGYTYASNNRDALTEGPTLGVWGGDNRKAIGGWGGRPLLVIASARIFFGGAGGMGDSNNSGNQPGGTGGGIVYIIAPNIAGSGNISSNGSDALNQVALNTGGTNDAPSGGAAGGTIVLKSTVANGITLNAKGGKGGDQGFLTGESEGPGGGGGGGFIGFTGGTPTLNVQGGANGITLSSSLTEFTPNGSTSGAAGQSQGVLATFITYVPVNVTATATTPVCAGSPITFTSTVNYPGGTYAWTGPVSFTSTAANPTIAAATVAHTGTYRVIYTSPGGCVDTAFVAVVVNPKPVVTTSVVQPLCNGACNGSATINFTTAGTPAYTYLWNNGQTTQTASSLCAGAYTATITDAMGCTATASATITAPVALTATSTQVNPLCNGACNGTITVTAAGGTGIKQYSIDGGAYQASNVFTGLCAGVHAISVKDANNCTTTLSPTLTQPTAVSVSISSVTAATCGTNNGTLTAVGAGGTTNYSYSIGGAPQASGTFAGLAPGAYTVTITDANGCTNTVGAVINSATSPIIAILNHQDVTCFGGLNGAVLVGPLGAGMTYSFNGGAFQASNSFTGLGAGTYTVAVKDANNCQASTTVTITTPTQLLYTTVATPASCNGVCDGQITITASGGTAPYQYSSNNGTSYSPANPQTGLCAGSIGVIVRDNNGCLSNSTVTVTQPALVAATFVNVDPICEDACNGQITVNATGGTPAYQYSVNGGAMQAGSTLLNLCSGNQVILVRDSHGCEFTATRTLINPPGFDIDLIQMIESNCGFQNGSLEVQAVGLNPGYTYSKNGEPAQTSGIFAPLLAGAYEIVATDALGCQETVFFGVNDIEMDGILIEQTDVLCYGAFDGTVNVINVGGFGTISYELDGSGITQTSGFFPNLPEGSHIVTIYDGGNCVFTIPIDMIQPDEISYDTDLTDVLCNDSSTGVIEFTNVAGGVGTHRYSIDGGTTFQNSPIFAGLPAGTYNLAVTDSNNCLVISTVIIEESDPITFVYSVFEVACNGNSSGFIQMLASGGTGSFQYSIDGGTNYATGGDFFTLSAGTYPVVVRDISLCTLTGTVMITEPPVLTASAVPTPATCSDACDGQIAVTAGGGTTPYQYSVDGGVTYAVAATSIDLCPGTYGMVVRDSNNCMTVAVNEIIGAPSPVTLTMTSINSTCSQANGQITVTAGGGTPTPAYTYSIDGITFVATNIFTGLVAGDYTLYVRDGQSCEVSADYTVVDDVHPVIANSALVNPLCNAACNGQITITATGGMGAMSYDIGGAPQASNVFTAVCAGVYLVTITDTNTCTDTLRVTLVEPPVLAMTSTATNLTCFNNSTGAVSVTATGGTGAYQYSFNNSAFGTGSSFNFLQAGIYDIAARDINACLVTGQQIVTQPADLLATMTLTDASCFDYCDGTAIANVTGGTTLSGTYTYIWSSNVTTSVQNQASALCDGAYSVIVRDDNNCRDTATFAITEPALFEIDSIDAIEPLCNTSCDGTITIAATGGVLYSFDGGTTSSASNVQTNVCAGAYNIQVTNAAGCIATGGILVEQPLPVQIFVTPDSLMCAGDTVPLYAIAVGGTEPFIYSWDNDPTVTGPTQDVHPAGPTTYNVFATDTNGCISPTVTTNLTMLQSLQIQATADTAVCLGESVPLSVNVITGYPAYSYQWSTAVNDTLTNVTVTPIAATSYIVTVTDQCVSLNDTVVVGFHNIPTFTYSVDFQQGCSPLTVTLSPDIDTALLGNTCTWTFSDGQVVQGCTSVTATFTDPGCYNLTYTGTTAEGCPMTGAFTDAICVLSNPIAAFSFNPTNPTVIHSSVHLTDLSLNADTYNWTFSNYGNSSLQNPTVSFLGAEPNEVVIVCLQVQSPDGCVDEICKPIKIIDDFVMYVPNAFTPDGDNANAVFLPVMPPDVTINEFHMTIFNRWGEIIFESYDYQRGWSGTYGGDGATQVQDGVYIWVIDVAEGSSNKKWKLEGHVNVLR
jgi:gliding motility-associated-like protein